MRSDNFLGKVAIVTGASRGIGRAIATELAKRSVKLVLTATSAESLEEVVRTLRDAGRDVRAIPTPENEADPVVSTAIKHFGRLDIVVNNAGTTKSGSFLELTEKDWADGFRTKFFGAVRLCKAAWPELKRTGGSITNIAGAGGKTPDSRFSIGGSVNAGLMAFTKALAELGTADGVQVNAISPGLIRTERLVKRIEHIMEQDGTSYEEAERRLIEKHKLIRIGEPNEIASLVCYLNSPEGRIFQGSLINADCGYTKSL